MPGPLLAPRPGGERWPAWPPAVARRAARYLARSPGGSRPLAPSSGLRGRRRVLREQHSPTRRSPSDPEAGRTFPAPPAAGARRTRRRAGALVSRARRPHGSRWRRRHPASRTPRRAPRHAGRPYAARPGSESPPAALRRLPLPSDHAPRPPATRWLHPWPEELERTAAQRPLDLPAVAPARLGAGRETPRARPRGAAPARPPPQARRAPPRPRSALRQCPRASAGTQASARRTWLVRHSYEGVTR